MTFTELQARATLLAKLEGWSDVSPAPDWAALVNQALDRFSWEGEYITDDLTVTTTAGTAEYTLLDTDTRPWKHLRDVIWASQSALEISGEDRIREFNRLWLVADRATPWACWLSTPNTLRLYPTPDTSSISVLVYGVRTEPALTGTNSPRCPVIYHEALARLAAAMQGLAYAESAEQLAKAVAYETSALEAARAYRAVLAEQRMPFGSGRSRYHVDRISLE